MRFFTFCWGETSTTSTSAVTSQTTFSLLQARTVGVIHWGAWMSELNVRIIDPVVAEILQSGPVGRLKSSKCSSCLKAAHLHSSLCFSFSYTCTVVNEVLSSVVEDVGQAVNRNISGAQILHELLRAPWLRALLKVRPGSTGVNWKRCTTEMWRRVIFSCFLSPDLWVPDGVSETDTQTPSALCLSTLTWGLYTHIHAALSDLMLCFASVSFCISFSLFVHQIMTLLQKSHRPSAEARELCSLLSSTHIQVCTLQTANIRNLTCDALS